MYFTFEADVIENTDQDILRQGNYTDKNIVKTTNQWQNEQTSTQKDIVQRSTQKEAVQATTCTINVQTTSQATAQNEGDQRTTERNGIQTGRLYYITLNVIIVKT